MAKANVFKTAKRLKSKHPGKSWQQLIQIAKKGGTSAAPKKKAAKKRKRVGAYKVIEKGESKRTPAKKVVRNVRTKKGLFKGVVTVGAVKQMYEEKLKDAMLKHHKATTIKATDKAAAEIRKYKKLLKTI